MNDQTNISRCRACGAPIYWATYEASGKVTPIDVEPDDTGNVILRRKLERDSIGKVIAIRLVARVLSASEKPESGEVRRKPHHATCKNWKR